MARLITELRHAVGDRRRRALFIRTVHGFGYAFCGKAVDDSGPAVPAAFTCSLVWGTREIGLVEGQNLIGRDPDCAVRIDSPRVSRRHARILVTGGAASIEDLGSKNGTIVAKRVVHEPTPLTDGDEVSVGTAVLFFRKGYGPGSTQTG